MVIGNGKEVQLKDQPEWFAFFKDTYRHRRYKTNLLISASEIHPISNYTVTKFAIFTCDQEPREQRTT